EGDHGEPDDQRRDAGAQGQRGGAAHQALSANHQGHEPEDQQCRGQQGNHGFPSCSELTAEISSVSMAPSAASSAPSAHRPRICASSHAARAASRQARRTASRRRSASSMVQSLLSSSTYWNTSGATMVASDSITNLGVSMSSLPQVIFSVGIAPEYEP